MDDQFEPLRPGLAAIPNAPLLNTVSEDEHVPEIERFNRTVKERARYSTVVIRTLPLMEIHGIASCLRPGAQFQNK